MLKINTPFLKILYVKLVGDNFCHLPQLPDEKLPSAQNEHLENMDIKSKGKKGPLIKNLTQYSYTGIKDFGYKKTPAIFDVTDVCKRIEL